MIPDGEGDFIRPIDEALPEIQFYDINKLPADGYVVLPISMTRIEHGQSPEVCYEILEFFESKVSEFGLDAVILYTDGLYFNTDRSATEVRKTTSGQVAAHKNALQNKIRNKRRFMPQAIHYLPWDYALLNSENFKGNFNFLRQCYEQDRCFPRSAACEYRARIPQTRANLRRAVVLRVYISPRRSFLDRQNIRSLAAR